MTNDIGFEPKNENERIWFDEMRKRHPDDSLQMTLFRMNFYIGLRQGLLFGYD